MDEILKSLNNCFVAKPKAEVVVEVHGLHKFIVGLIYSSFVELIDFIENDPLAFQKGRKSLFTYFILVDSRSFNLCCDHEIKFAFRIKIELEDQLS